jgi:hypothetical protein
MKSIKPTPECKACRNLAKKESGAHCCLVASTPQECREKRLKKDAA